MQRTISFGKKPVEKTKILFDIKEMKVGCALLQAAYGGDPSVCNRVDVRHWLVETTPDLKLYEVSPEQFGILIQRMDALR